ncbi:E3 ubiquitin- ligase ATL41-like [Olea europaea subsp. europaea]|uniref:RING-type E3 ubiquitin transferase n=1 Tax=Olea europaea subsp. europaea TaxID=158383 RepID=A0A8S0PS07_OLEEU|nr:E3 ubiquitin- ligase ATL41-like [Olea europaea subsp. europaea]
MGSDDVHNEKPHFIYRKSNYDLHSKIMLTAIISLSVVVVLVTILHIYVRCYVRRRQARGQTSLFNLGYVISAAPTEPLPLTTGLDPSVMASLPIFAFKKTNGNDNDDQMGSSVECSVCLSMLEDGEMARTLPNCKHTFHAECIDKWFGSNSTCPLCRTDAEPRLVVAEAPEGTAGVGGATPSAPPLEGRSSSLGGGTQSSARISGSNSRISSFRRILSQERSSRRIRSCEEDGLPDIERQ